MKLLSEFSKKDRSDYLKRGVVYGSLGGAIASVGSLKSPNVNSYRGNILKGIAAGTALGVYRTYRKKKNSKPPRNIYRRIGYNLSQR